MQSLCFGSGRLVEAQLKEPKPKPKTGAGELRPTLHGARSMPPEPLGFNWLVEGFQQASEGFSQTVSDESQVPIEADSSKPRGSIRHRSYLTQRNLMSTEATKSSVGAMPRGHWTVQHDPSCIESANDSDGDSFRSERINP